MSDFTIAVQVGTGPDGEPIDNLGQAEHAQAHEEANDTSKPTFNANGFVYMDALGRGQALTNQTWSVIELLTSELGHSQ